MFIIVGNLEKSVSNCPCLVRFKTMNMQSKIKDNKYT